MSELIFKAESYQIIGLCMEVHRELGRGHNEIIYKEALQYELGLNQIPFTREKEYTVQYKRIILAHKYYADFVVLDKILLELKAVEGLVDSHVKQVLNYIAAAKLKLGLLVNFGEDSLVYKRIVP